MPEEPNTFQIIVDGEPYRIPGPTASGAQLKAAAGKDAIYQLFREGTGNDPDQMIADQQAIIVEDGMHFYTVPPAMMGIPWAQ